MALIRPARPAEAGMLTSLAFRSKASWGYDADFMARCRDALTVTPTYIEHCRVRVAEVSGKVVGFYALNAARYQVELDLLFVDPAAFRQGIGRELLLDACNASRKDGYSALFIESDPGAEAFYAAMGGVRVGTVASPADAERRLPLLRIDLAAAANSTGVQVGGSGNVA